jgi:hypothetical protein
MIMHPVNSRVGVPGMGGIGGLPVITGTKRRAASRPAANPRTGGAKDRRVASTDAKTRSSQS